MLFRNKYDILYVNYFREAFLWISEDGSISFMADYTGIRCIVCNEKFDEKDDVVVCPECGTPYHRACYAKNGKCVNTALHESGRSWQPAYDVGGGMPSESDTVCRRCGFHNDGGELFCARCGFPMKALEEHNETFRSQNQQYQDGEAPGEYNRNFNNTGAGVNIQPFLINFSDPLCGYNPDEDFDGVRLCELGDYVESNTHYYLPNFKRIKETGRTMTWNFAAMLFPEFYFANRKMPLVALAVFIVRFFAVLPYYIAVLSQTDVAVLSELARSFDIRSQAFQMLNVFSYIVSYGVMFFCGAFANWIYYRHAVKKTAKIKVSVPPQFLRQTLRSKGGTSALWLVLFIIVYLLPYCLIYFFAYYGILFQ